MTQAPDKEDEQWLRALAGNPDPDAKPSVNQQADALRRALRIRKDLLDAAVPMADTAQYEQLMFRLRREGLPEYPAEMADERAARVVFRTRKEGAQPPLDAQDLDNYVIPPFLRKDESNAFWRTTTFWGIAATLVLAIGVVVEMGGLHFDQGDTDTLRGGGPSTVLIVPEPEVRLAELLAGLRAAGEEPTVKRAANGRIVLTVKGSAKVLAYLSEQRIEPTLHQGRLTIELQPVKAKP